MRLLRVLFIYKECEADKRIGENLEANRSKKIVDFSLSKLLAWIINIIKINFFILLNNNFLYLN